MELFTAFLFDVGVYGVVVGVVMSILTNLCEPKTANPREKFTAVSSAAARVPGRKGAEERRR